LLGFCSILESLTRGTHIWEVPAGVLPAYGAP
jgi:hypothetical protein